MVNNIFPNFIENKKINFQVDDAEDADIVSLLIDPTPPEGFHVVSTETVHGLEDLEIVKNLQMFTQVWRAKIPFGQPLSAFNQHFNRLLQVCLINFKELSSLMTRIQSRFLFVF